MTKYEAYAPIQKEWYPVVRMPDGRLMWRCPQMAITSTINDEDVFIQNLEENYGLKIREIESEAKDESKPPACCKSCKFLYGNSAPDDGWKPCEIASMFKKLKWELCASFCAAYNGPGITPWQESDEARRQEAFHRALLAVATERIAELKAENKMLNNHACELQFALGKIADESEDLIDCESSPKEFALAVLERLKKEGANFVFVPVAKPLMWNWWDGNGKECICFAPLGGYFLTIEEQDGEYYLYYHGTQLPPSPFSRHTPFKSIDAAKQAAQDWLNKLVAECALTINPTESLPPTNCDAILKGGEND